MVVETTTKGILDLLTAGITISGVDLDIRDLTSASDSVEIIQDTFADCKVEVHTAEDTILPTGIYGWDGSLWETLNTDTNNRLLVAATGAFYPATQPVSGTFWQATQPVSGTFWQDTQPVSGTLTGITNDVSIDDGGNSITVDGTFWQDTQPVSATDLDIRDLTNASDSVEVYPHKATTIAFGPISVGDTATQILVAQATRTGFIIVNNSAQTVYLGTDEVTTVTGIPLEAGASYSNDLWVGAFYGIVAADTADVRAEDFY